MSPLVRSYKTRFRYMLLAFPVGASILVALSYVVLKIPAHNVLLILGNGTLVLVSFFIIFELIVIRSSKGSENELMAYFGALFLILGVYLVSCIMFNSISIPSIDRAIADQIPPDDIDFSDMTEKNFWSLMGLTSLNLVLPVAVYVAVVKKLKAVEGKKWG